MGLRPYPLLNYMMGWSAVKGKAAPILVRNVVILLLLIRGFFGSLHINPPRNPRWTL
jgi:hypothetical protein